ncbi:hypothetical protein CFY86_29105 [Raoultella ornithinolytica]|uniref:Uncharacterized protein n=1 Tax=Raoultella ornithinolytica TaxID=54291 RepID=A0A855F0I4_RAOOR|nr:hypothetical protein [Raoultella ornithinolytica]QJK23422.1 hypothetical protein HJX28_15840 [Klebsiella pneumoniae]PIK80782.1 hypothetical protein CFY86_29105 [Raoultella ornithinolytica]HBS9329755.1 hypothetical protein [Klebsiella pneumoniae]HBS9341677.1 hypothetical protein [Klebsiella pneumoniae]HCM1639089.1 hypothetical protein [Klebsiella pneumoniae]
MRKTTAVIDSPEALGAALCRHVPDMANGFTITTRDSQLQLTVTAEDTRPFIAAMEHLLKRKIRQIQHGYQSRSLDEKRDQIVGQIKGLNALAINQITQIGFPELTPEEWESINQVVRTAALRKRNGLSPSTAI